MTDPKKIDLTKLQVREFVIKEGDVIVGDLRLTSLVFDPAIKQNTQFFSELNNYSFAVIDEEKRLIIGPAMRPNLKIVREDPKTKEYFMGWFSEKTVEYCRNIFYRNSNHTKMNFEHGEMLGENNINGIYAVESWVVENPLVDKATALGFKNVAKGDWYLGYYVESPTLFQAIKDSGLKGFSIEGQFVEKFSALSIKPNEEEIFENKIKELAFNDKITDDEFEKELKKIIF